MREQNYRWLEEVLLKEGEVRPLWRFMLSAPLIVLAVMLAVMASAGIRPHPSWLGPNLGPLFWQELFLFPLLLFLFGMLTGVMDRKPLGSVGFAFHERWKQELAMGLGLGGGMMLLVAGLEHTLGWARFSPSGRALESVLTASGFYIFFLILAAANEELVFRGYAFQRLVDAIRPAGAVVAFSVLFGLGHLENPSHTWISTVNTVLIGVVLAVAYLRTRALWVSLGIHFAWNYVQGVVFGFPVSGLTIPHAWMAARVHGSALLTGKSYGPEGSLLTTGVIIAGLVYVSSSPRMKTTRTMQRLSLPAPRWGLDAENYDIFPEGPSDSKKE
jgi:membrane protease YdiL (CAAX protease family)